MKSAPFSFSIPMLIMLIAALFLGAVLGGLFGNSSIAPLVGGFLTCFLILPIMSFLRIAAGSAMAHAAGVRGEAPFAWPFYIRYLIGAGISGLVAFTGISILDQELNVFSGAIFATIAASIMSIIMVIKVSMADLPS